MLQNTTNTTHIHSCFDNSTKSETYKFFAKLNRVRGAKSFSNLFYVGTQVLMSTSEHGNQVVYVFSLA